MRTFSEIIDIAILTTSATNDLHYAVVAANGVVKEVAKKRLSDWDLVEERVRGSSWEVPNNFLTMRAVDYDSFPAVPKRKPGLIQKTDHRYWYRTGATVCFSGIGDDCANIAYYTSPRHMMYREQSNRLIRSVDEDHIYEIRTTSEDDDLWEPYDENDPDHKSIWLRNVNWVLRDHYDVVLEGVIAKVFNSRGRLNEGARHYNQYVAGLRQVERWADAHIIGEN